MRGTFLVKFDERRGFIPVNPILLDDSYYLKNQDLLKEIAKNAIGFGSLEFNSFELQGINCISKKFTIPKESARGGGETFSLVIVSDKDVMRFKTGLNTTIEKLMQNWSNVEKYMQNLYKAVKYPEQPILFKDEQKK